jgi:hypothetical protein
MKRCWYTSPWLPLAVSVLLAATGCSQVAKVERSKRITSDPPGATVYARGVEIGTTPLSILPDEAFPPGFVGLSYRAHGILMLKKPGCKTYTQEVDDGVLAKDIHVRLECGPNYSEPQSPENASEKGAQSPMPAEASSPVADSVEARLRRLDDLHKKGLVSDQEYEKSRQRILNNL